MKGQLVKEPLELELFTGEEQRSGRGRGGLVRSGPVIPTTLTTPNPHSPNPTGATEPIPGSLRQTGRIVTARISYADYLWLKSSGIQPGEVLRRFIEIHRGDRDVQELERQERESRVRLVALHAAREIAVSKFEERRQELDRAESVQKHLDRLRRDFQAANRAGFGHRIENRNWLKGRTDADPLLRGIPPLELLDQLLGNEPT